MSQSIKECQRCTATTAKGRPCKNRTCRGNFCWQHLRKERGLTVKQSSIPNAGLGLFATKSISGNKMIDHYTGESLTKSQVDERYASRRGDYVLCFGKKCVDGRKTNSNFARFANNSRNTKKKNNARLTKAFTLKSTRKINPGQEVLTAYGRDYWK